MNTTVSPSKDNKEVERNRLPVPSSPRADTPLVLVIVMNTGGEINVGKNKSRSCHGSELLLASRHAYARRRHC